MKTSTETADGRESTAIAAPRIIPLAPADSIIDQDLPHIVRLSTGVPGEATLETAEGTMIHEMPRASDSVETRRRAA